MLLALGAFVGLAAGVAYACPAPAIRAGPAPTTRSTVARFSFDDAWRNVSFLCSLDGTGYKPCSSPWTYHGLAARRHNFSVKVANSRGETSVSSSYSWRIDTAPPSIEVRFPRNARSYNASRWNAGCHRRQPGLCGRATDPVWVTLVLLSIKQNSTHKYWNGRGFRGRKEMWLRARLLARRYPDGSPHARDWFYGLAVPFPDGSYTIHVRAKDSLGNSTPRQTATRSLFVIDDVPPVVAITAFPPDPSASRNARFAFHANEPRVRFRCRFDAGRFAVCRSPIWYRGLATGHHSFRVVGSDPAGNASPSRYGWQIVTPASLSLSGGPAPSEGVLLPGLQAEAVTVTLGNPHPAAIHVTTVRVSVRTTGAPGCSSAWFQITQARFPAAGITIPSHGSVRLPAQGASAPTIRLVETGTNQDACQGARLTLVYTGSAFS